MSPTIANLDPQESDFFAGRLEVVRFPRISRIYQGYNR